MLRRRRVPAPDHDVRISYVRERIRTGLWFIPLMAVAAAWLASILMHRLDLELGGDRPDFLAYDGTPTQSSQVLSTIAGSTLTFTGIVFSITAVALQLGSSQFSPRALRNFLRDRGTQWALGLLVATFTYALLTLRYVDPDAPADEVATPGLSVTLALVLVVASLVGFVFFVSHLAQSIRVVSIIERVAGETRKALRETLPPDGPVIHATAPERPPDQVVTWARGPAVLIGYDEDDLVEIARTSGTLLRFCRQVGDYLPSGVPVVEVWRTGEGAPPGDGSGLGTAVEPRAVLRRIGGGIERTMAQDPMFGFRQLVDIAERAVSPAINDPTTAVQALDRIHDLLRRVAAQPDPVSVYADHAGTPRLIVPVPSWSETVHLACDEIRHYGAPSLQVARRLRAMLEDLLTVVSPERTVEIHHQLALLDRAVDRHYVDPDERLVARGADHQGLGSRPL